MKWYDVNWKKNNANPDPNFTLVYLVSLNLHTLWCINWKTNSANPDVNVTLIGA